MPTNTDLSNLKINVLTQAQFDSATKNQNELYLVKDSGINASLINQVYPVESVYLSTRNFDPATLFGGTWIKLGSDIIGSTSVYYYKRTA